MIFVEIALWITAIAAMIFGLWIFIDSVRRDDLWDGWLGLYVVLIGAIGFGVTYDTHQMRERRERLADVRYDSSGVR